MIRRLILLTFIVILTTAFRATPVHGPGLTVVGRPAAGLPPAQEAPSGRLAQAQEAFAAGDDETARSRFEAILADPTATPDEQRLALYWRGRSELEGGDAAAAVATLDQFLQQYPGDALAEPLNSTWGGRTRRPASLTRPAPLIGRPSCPTIRPMSTSTAK